MHYYMIYDMAADRVLIILFPQLEKWSLIPNHVPLSYDYVNGKPHYKLFEQHEMSSTWSPPIFDNYLPK